jgi:hypothetical protein
MSMKPRGAKFLQAACAGVMVGVGVGHGESVFAVPHHRATQPRHNNGFASNTVDLPARSDTREFFCVHAIHI